MAHELLGLSTQQEINARLDYEFWSPQEDYVPSLEPVPSLKTIVRVYFSKERSKLASDVTEKERRRMCRPSPNLNSHNPFSQYEEQLDVLTARMEMNETSLSNLRHFRREYVRKESPKAHNPQKPRYKTEEESLRGVNLLTPVGEEARYVARLTRSMGRHCEKVKEQRYLQILEDTRQEFSFAVKRHARTAMELERSASKLFLIEYNS